MQSEKKGKAEKKEAPCVNEIRLSDFRHGKIRDNAERELHEERRKERVRPSNRNDCSMRDKSV